MMLGDSRQPSPLLLPDLIQSAIDGSLALPEFQRDFVWRPADVKLLLSSVAMGWPIGSFMIWQPKDFQMAAKSFDGLTRPRKRSDQSFLLDGQQRLTALIHALEPDNSKDHKYLLARVTEYLTNATLLDIEEHIVGVTNAQFGKRYASLQQRAAQDVALIADIADEQTFSDWQDHYVQHHKPPEKPQFFGLRGERLPGLASYSVPCVLLPRDLELEAVARIFETTNKTGVKLGIVDLMIAKLYPAEFNLRDEWDRVLEERHDVMGSFKDALDAEDVLRVLAFWHTKGTGVTRERILRLDAEEVKSDWSRAVDCVCDAVSLLSQRCGVVQGTLLPARLMILPVAVALGEATRTEHDRSNLEDYVEQWFWRSIIEETFVRSTNTRAISEARRLIEYVSHNHTDTTDHDDDGLATGHAESLRDRLLEARGSDGILEAAVQALVVSRKGRDWRAGGKELASCAGDLTKHHIIPQKGAGVDKWARRNCIANLTPQSMASNRELRNDLPIDIEVPGPVVDAHFCDVAELGSRNAEGFDRFVERRASEIAKAMVALATGSNAK